MKRMLLLLTATAALGGCTALDRLLPGAPASGPRAIASLAPTQGNQVTGTVEFVQQADRVVVSGEVRGLRPNAEHGFHVHEKGDCSAPDGTSAGGHFNPAGHPHGRPAAQASHAGDLPNLRSDADGVARFRYEAAALRVGSGAGDVVGRGLVVHRDPDDYGSQPAGNSGPRLACAVIVRR